MLPIAAGRTLVGCYASVDAQRCDVENLLLYNVGLRAFAHLHVHDIVLVRSMTPPPPPDGVSKALGHHHRYELADVAPPAPSGPVVARLAPTPLRMPLRVASVWYDIRSKGHLEVGDGAGELLAVEVTVHRPPSAFRPGLLGVVKVAVDGFISALHTHDGSELAVVAERLGARLGLPREGVADLLLANPPACLASAACCGFHWTSSTGTQPTTSSAGSG